MSTWSEADIPDQTGRVALVTGANSGLGFETARALAQHGAHVVMGCRNPDRAADAEARINETSPSGSVEVLLVDMADLESIAAGAEGFLTDHERLDLLVNNAGIMATPKGATAQGFEQQFGVNHLGHVALTAPLLPALLAADGSRVVNVSSNAHKFGRMNFDDLMGERSYNPWRAYGQSKLANLLFTRELQRRLAAGGVDTIAVAAHPGASKTELGKESGGILSTLMNLARPVTDRLMSQSAAMGALPQLRAAVDPTVVGGEYYGPSGFGEMQGHPERVDTTGRARSDEDAARLWDISVELTGADYSTLDG